MDERKVIPRYPDGRVEPGHGTPFSPENQPENRGRKKVAPIRKLMVEFGRALAPRDLRDNEIVRAFLDEHNMKGTVNEVLVARLYSLALYQGDLKAIKLMMDTLNGNYGGGKNRLTINFIAPVAETQESVTDLRNDSWTNIFGESGL